MNNNFPKWPYFSSDEIDIVTKILQSGQVNYWTGEECKLFEQAYAKYLNVPYCISLANGTVALELALHALGIGAKDDVVVPARTFIATASCVVARGARPIVADIDRDSQNITIDTIERVITPKTKAIIVVHLAGWPCDMDPILDYAKRRNLKVIEDCAQAHGAFYKGKPVGSFGDAAAFSFCQDKVITTGGEGGLLVLHDIELWKKAWSYKDHGKNYELTSQSIFSPGFRWTHDSFGTNWRMIEIQAAIGRLQLGKLDDWVKTRRRNANILASCCEQFQALQITKPGEDFFHSYYKYYVFIKPEMLRQSWDRDKVISAIQAEGVPCFSGSCPEIYREKAFVDAGFIPKQRFRVSKELGETSLMFLVHPTLTAENMQTMCNVIEKIMKQSSYL